MIAGHGLVLDTSRTSNQTTIGWGQVYLKPKRVLQDLCSIQVAVTLGYVSVLGGPVDSLIHHWTRLRVLGSHSSSGYI